MGKLINLAGKKFGRLTVLQRSDRVGNCAYWECRCDCGSYRVVASGNLINGTSKSCSCLRNENNINHRKTHDMYKTKPYNTWQNMKERCGNIKNKQYKDYGGRGISVCEEWKNSFIRFWEDMGGSYKPGLTIERIDNNGNYNKDNCTWIPKSHQGRNRRANVLNEEAVKVIKYYHQNKDYNISRIAKTMNVAYGTIASVILGNTWKEVSIP